MDKSIEYKIITSSTSECQTWLNQWRHKYNLTIIAMCNNGELVTILLTRERKDGE